VKKGQHVLHQADFIAKGVDKYAGMADKYSGGAIPGLHAAASGIHAGAKAIHKGRQIADKVSKKVKSGGHSLEKLNTRKRIENMAKEHAGNGFA
jgi:hypothetical protein